MQLQKILSDIPRIIMHTEYVGYFGDFLKLTLFMALTHRVCVVNGMLCNSV